MIKIFTTTILSVVFPFLMIAQNAGTKAADEVKKPSFGITFSGYIKTDILYDTRQVVGARDNQFLFYPEPIRKDARGNDVNAKSQFDMLCIQTRVVGNITAPDALGAKTSGFIEAEFFGNINQNINTFRLRHAYVKLTWPKSELLVGQNWHPMFSTNCYPNTVSFNTGLLFTVFSRNPQVRFTKSLGPFSASLAALSQIDFPSNGPEGANTKYLRNSGIPELDLQLQYRKKNETTGTEFLVGAGIDYLVILPRLSADVITKKPYDTVINNVIVHTPGIISSYKTDVTTGAFSYNAMAKLALKALTFKAGLFYGENCYAFNMLGGYAVEKITDTARGFVDYKNLRTMTSWADISTNGKKWELGIFSGFSRNLGAGTILAGPYYTRGSDIDYVYRISPRVYRKFDRLKLAAELEYTVAAYGKTNEKGYVFNSSEVGNLRILLGVYYSF